MVKMNGYKFDFADYVIVFIIVALYRIFKKFPYCVIYILATLSNLDTNYILHNAMDLIQTCLIVAIT